MLLRVVGWLLLIETLFMLAPLATCLYYGEADWQAFAAGALTTMVTGLILTRLVRPAHSFMGKREGFLLTALVWVVFSLFGMLPFITSSTPMSVTDAFFESMSGFTTTGVSVLESMHGLGHGLLMWRAVMQWVGGMGIILFTLAVLPMLNSSGGMQMFNAEVTGITHDKLRPRVSQTAKSLWMVYISLTALLVGLLWLGPMSGFESICHAFGAISTGGFSTVEGTIDDYHSDYIKLILTLFMFLGGVNFSLIFRGVQGNWKAIRQNDVLKVYVAIIGAMLVIFAADIFFHQRVERWQAYTIDPLFAIVSTLTSTGYDVGMNVMLNPITLSLMFLMMGCGACAGSTSGGAKIDRIIYLFKHCRNEVYRCIYPNTILSVRVDGKVINPTIVSKVVAFLCIYIMLIVFGGIALALFDVRPVEAFFASYSCVSNTGLGTSVLGSGQLYATLPGAGKWVLTFLMLVGRLELFTVLLLFIPTFWRR